MVNGIQQLVNAQVDINRAVHEANYPQPGIKGQDRDPRPEYIQRCVESAIQSLQQYLKEHDTNQRKANSKPL